MPNKPTKKFQDRANKYMALQPSPKAEPKFIENDRQQSIRDNNRIEAMEHTKSVKKDGGEAFRRAMKIKKYKDGTKYVDGTKHVNGYGQNLTKKGDKYYNKHGVEVTEKGAPKMNIKKASLPKKGEFGVPVNKAGQELIDASAKERASSKTAASSKGKGTGKAKPAVDSASKSVSDMSYVEAMNADTQRQRSLKVSNQNSMSINAKPLGVSRTADAALRETNAVKPTATSIADKIAPTKKMTVGKHKQKEYEPVFKVEDTPADKENIDKWKSGKEAINWIAKTHTDITNDNREHLNKMAKKRTYKDVYGNVKTLADDEVYDSKTGYVHKKTKK